MLAQLKLVRKKTDGRLEINALGAVVPLAKGKDYLVGRESADFPVPDEFGYISRRQVAVRVEPYREDDLNLKYEGIAPEAVLVKDGRSANGTTIEIYSGDSNRQGLRFGLDGKKDTRLDRQRTAEEFYNGDGVRLWFGVKPRNFEAGEETVVLDVFDSRLPEPPNRFAEAGFGRLPYGPSGQEKVGFTP